MPGYEPCRFLQTLTPKDLLCSVCTYVMKIPLICSKCKVLACQDCSKKTYFSIFSIKNPIFHLKTFLYIKRHHLWACLFSERCPEVEDRCPIDKMQVLDKRLHGDPEDRRPARSRGLAMLLFPLPMCPQGMRGDLASGTHQAHARMRVLHDHLWDMQERAKTKRCTNKKPDFFCFFL